MQVHKTKKRRDFSSYCVFDLCATGENDYLVNVSNVVRQSERRRRPAVNLAPCICAAAVVYRSTLPCCAQCKTRPCLADASPDADKRFAYVDKTYLMCYI